MKKEYHYFFNAIKDKNQKILNFLDEKEIKYTTIDDCISLRIYDDDLYFSEIVNLFSEISIKPQIRLEYTKKELSEAKYLRIWLRRYSGYPQPEGLSGKASYLDYTYDIANFCTNCGSGLVQKDSFYLRKSFSINRYRFGGVYWIYDTFFITTELRDLFVKEGFTGMEFLPVKEIKSKKTFENIVQLKINAIFPAKMKYEKEKIIDCKECNQKRDIMKTSSEIFVSKDIFETLDKDFYLSQEFTGDGLLCCKHVLISNRVYKFLIKNKINNVCAETINFV